MVYKKLCQTLNRRQILLHRGALQRDRCVRLSSLDGETTDCPAGELGHTALSDLPSHLSGKCGVYDSLSMAPLLHYGIRTFDFMWIAAVRFLLSFDIVLNAPPAMLAESFEKRMHRPFITCREA